MIFLEAGSPVRNKFSSHSQSFRMGIFWFFSRVTDCSTKKGAFWEKDWPLVRKGRNSDFADRSSGSFGSVLFRKFFFVYCFSAWARILFWTVGTHHRNSSTKLWCCLRSLWHWKQLDPLQHASQQKVQLQCRWYSIYSLLPTWSVEVYQECFSWVINTRSF